jgi:hypothetical protein
MVVNNAEERQIKYIKNEIRDLNTTADAFLLFSGNVSIEVFYKRFDRILSHIQEHIDTLKASKTQDLGENI